MSKSINKNAAEMKANKKKIKYATSEDILNDKKNVSYAAYQLAKEERTKAAGVLNAAQTAAKGLKKNAKNPNTKNLIKAKIASIDAYNKSVKIVNDARAQMFKTSKKKKRGLPQIWRRYRRARAKQMKLISTQAAIKKNP